VELSFVADWWTGESNRQLVKQMDGFPFSRRKTKAFYFLLMDVYY
jgi:hypothetical protein